MSQSEYVAVQTTVASQQEAETLASAILEARLAACIQVSEVRSYYRWDGVQNDAEQLLTCKTTSACVPGLKELIDDQHPYEEPELIVLPILDGSSGYLNWVSTETS
ncbi:divalent-cation tolerance protein CutA [Nesterenkonia sp. MY13]|uniref:Divalent-cation tolerance protein CutA n=1 Tax=Nesterenkonia sedimenti TaxID=1463632 RepID=A0A7X8TIM7_9MICC|nr:divalent-cation tolerance protein CutA [Nesterenkonia sedimenti]NLS09462.1 divalent-cation tolerance protein CutA [Nesterenkonia sedimenti]